jgi:hypothetical protein
MKKNKALILLVLILCSCSNTGKQNLENLEKVQIGMHLRDVKKIMNKPHKERVAYWDNSLFVYYYEATFGASGDIEIVFVKRDSIVVKTYNGG